MTSARAIATFSQPSLTQFRACSGRYPEHVESCSLESAESFLPETARAFSSGRPIPDPRVGLCGGAYADGSARGLGLFPSAESR